MNDKDLIGICINMIAVLSLLYKDKKIDKETYTQHIKLKIKILNDLLN